MLTALLLVAAAQLPPPLRTQSPALTVYPSQSSGLPILGAGECTGSALLGSRGEAITITRASAALCENSAGVVTSVTNNLPQAARGSVLGEPAATFLALWPRDLSQAGSWAVTNMSCVKTATGKTGAANSASTCTASAGNGTVIQSITVASAARTTSLDVKRRTGTGNIDLTRDNGAAWTTLDATNCFDFWGVGTAPNASTWVRCRLTSTLANPQIGIRLVTNGDAVDVDYFDDEAGSTATSRCDNSGSTCTRAAINTSMTGPATVLGEGSFAADVTLLWSTAPSSRPMLFDLNSGVANGRVDMGYLSASTAWTCRYQNTAGTVYTATKTHTPSAATKYRARCRWSVSRQLLCASVDGAETCAGTGPTGTAFVPATLYLGYDTPGVDWIAGHMGNICLDSRVDGCR